MKKFLPCTLIFWQWNVVEVMLQDIKFLSDKIIVLWIWCKKKKTSIPVFHFFFLKCFTSLVKPIFTICDLIGGMGRDGSVHAISIRPDPTIGPDPSAPLDPSYSYALSILVIKNVLLGVNAGGNLPRSWSIRRKCKRSPSERFNCLIIEVISSSVA